MSYATGVHEDAFPEHKKGGVAWGMEAGRNYEDVWKSDQSPIVPSETLHGYWAPDPRVKIGLGVIGTGIGAQLKGVLGYQDNWAGAVVGKIGWVGGDNSDPWTHVRTWKANGVVAELDGVMSVGNHRPERPTKSDILLAVSVGPKVIYTWLAYEQLGGGESWQRSLVDYGAFVGISLERGFFKCTAEISALQVDRPSRGFREVRPFGGVRLHFRW